MSVSAVSVASGLGFCLVTVWVLGFFPIFLFNLQFLAVLQNFFPRVFLPFDHCEEIKCFWL